MPWSGDPTSSHPGADPSGQGPELLLQGCLDPVQGEETQLRDAEFQTPRRTCPCRGGRTKTHRLFVQVNFVLFVSIIRILLQKLTSPDVSGNDQSQYK